MNTYPAGCIRRLELSQRGWSPCLWLIALVLLSVHSGNAGGPPMAPPGYRLVYNVNGDHLFRLIRAIPPSHTHGSFSGSPEPPSCSGTPVSLCGTTFPLFSVTDTGVGTSGAYLVTIQGTQSGDINTPLQIVNQTLSTSSGLPSSPILSSGNGGIDLIQSSPVPNGNNTTPSNYSPAVTFTAQIWNTAIGTSGGADTETWYFQNQPATNASITGSYTVPQAVFALVHMPPASGAGTDKNNLTFQVPAGVNIAAGTPTDASPQLTVGSTITSNLDLSSVPVTLVGPSTLATGSSGVNVKAGATQIWPGFLRKTLASGANPFEGALEIGVALYPGATTTPGLLACYTGSSPSTYNPQIASTCTSATQSLIGVFFFTAGSGSSVVALAPPSRASVSTSSSARFYAGELVCRSGNTA